MRRNAIAATMIFLSLLATSVVAQDGTKPAREAMMKKIGASIGTMADMAKGKTPYDAEAIKTALATISQTAKAFPDQFKPDSDKTDKAASPKIWDNPTDFQAHANELSGDADMIMAQLPADPAGVGIALKTLGSDCSSCHQAYRMKD